MIDSYSYFLTYVSARACPMGERTSLHVTWDADMSVNMRVRPPTLAFLGMSYESIIPILTPS